MFIQFSKKIEKIEKYFFRMLYAIDYLRMSSHLDYYFIVKKTSVVYPVYQFNTINLEHYFTSKFNRKRF